MLQHDAVQSLLTRFWHMLEKPTGDLSAGAHETLDI